ncbi:MAG: DUF1214 domain-containing protein [Alphaproteobacteria bacterium]|nr:DUF1214 domain-containing protein [Alphaproteobacteria bacterium]
MIQRVALWIALTAAGLGLGGGSAWWAIRGPGPGQSLALGPWRADLLVGSRQAGLYTRARVAMSGLLGLGRAETLYFVARSDDRGRPLDGACAYRIEGPAPAARWWSLTVYDADHFLIDHPTRRFSINSAQAGAAGDLAVTLAAEARAEPWLPVPRNAPFELTLRLYNPATELAARPEALIAPRIRAEEGCR